MNDAGAPVEPGAIGTLLIRGDSTCASYWKYSVDEHGFYFFAGRSDDMIKVGGIWVSPTEVEAVLLEHHAVHACGVAGKADADGLVKPVAFIVPAAGVRGSAELTTELQQLVRTRLAEYKRPRWVEFVEALPTTATGKIQRFKLREMPVSGTGASCA